MERKDILERIKKYLDDKDALMGLDVEVTEDTLWDGDLGLDSLELVELLMDLEIDYGIQIDNLEADIYKRRIGSIIDEIELKLRRKNERQ